MKYMALVEKGGASYGACVPDLPDVSWPDKAGRKFSD
jgi:predicted RNase H-like HicB family nuclease